MQRFTDTSFHERQPRLSAARRLEREGDCTTLLVTIYCLMLSEVSEVWQVYRSGFRILLSANARAYAFVMRHQICHAKEAKQLTYVYAQICIHFVS